MSTLFFERSPFDIMVRNFLSQSDPFRPVESNIKINHPVDIYQNSEGLVVDIACTGIDKKDIDVSIEGNILKINYVKPKIEDEDEKVDYIFRGIAKRSFDLGWKIDSKFNLSKANAEFINGLLKISIPFAKESAPKTLKIS